MLAREAESKGNLVIARRVVMSCGHKITAGVRVIYWEW
jgi:hypothetical protein